MIGCTNLAASADQIIFTSDAVIGDGNTSYEGYDVIVRGCTLTINGSHSFNSLTAERNASNVAGVVTHSANFSNGTVNGFALAIAGDVMIQGADGSLVASRIDAAERGYPAASGPGAGADGSYIAGGGGHGGCGAPSSGGHAGGNAYDGVKQPAAFGSGGGNTSWASGGAGGGCVTLAVGGTLTLNGLITVNGANGQPAYDTQRSGAGAGGAVRITAGQFVGSGAVTANGGYGMDCWNGTSGGGAGGRIAIQANASSFTGTINAFGDVGGIRAGAGTVFTKFGGQTDGRLVIANSNAVGEITPSLIADAFDEVVVGLDARLSLSGVTALSADTLTVANGGRLEINTTVVFGDVHVQSGGVIAPVANDPNFHLQATNVEIQTGGLIDGAALGYPASSGPGAGGDAENYAAGGGHGGFGGDGGTGAAGGDSYGSSYAPLDMGSGGGAHTNFYQPGGAGGAVLRITVDETLLVNGAIHADGGDGRQAYDNAASGGGAGGGIYLRVGQLDGTGTISANGGSTTLQAGGGGGGRIAVRTCDPILMASSNITVNGGDGYYDGQPGTFFVGSPYINLTQPPTNRHFRIGQTATFTVAATTSAGTLHHHWRKDGVELADNGRITGSGTATLTISNLNVDDYGLYDVVLTDDCADFIPESVILTKPGDLDYDLDVDLSDLAQLLGHYGMSTGLTYEMGDLDEDGDIDLADLAEMLGNYGSF